MFHNSDNFTQRATRYVIQKASFNLRIVILSHLFHRKNRKNGFRRNTETFSKKYKSSVYGLNDQILSPGKSAQADFIQRQLPQYSKYNPKIWCLFLKFNGEQDYEKLCVKGIVNAIFGKNWAFLDFSLIVFEIFQTSGSF